MKKANTNEMLANVEVICPKHGTIQVRNYKNTNPKHIHRLPPLFEICPLCGENTIFKLHDAELSCGLIDPHVFRLPQFCAIPVQFMAERHRPQYETTEPNTNIKVVIFRTKTAAKQFCKENELSPTRIVPYGTRFMNMYAIGWNNAITYVFGYYNEKQVI